MSQPRRRVAARITAAATASASAVFRIVMVVDAVNATTVDLIRSDAEPDVVYPSVPVYSHVLPEVTAGDHVDVDITAEGVMRVVGKFA